MSLIKKNLYFIGIGGMGMSGLATYLFKSGCRIEGSDNKENGEYILQLKKLGIKINGEHCKKNISKNIDYIIYSTAIDINKNEEILEAINLNIKILHRSQLLNILLKDNYALTISGQAGKTTTSTIVTELLYNNNNNPSFIIGGTLNLFNSQYNVGSKYFIAEIDESDCISLENINSQVCILTNIYNPDLYQETISIDDLIYSFTIFIENLHKNGVAIINGDNENLIKIKNKLTDKKFITFGLSNSNDIYCSNIRYLRNSTIFDINIKDHVYDLLHKKKKMPNLLTNIECCLFGEHNVYNCLSGVGICLIFEIEEKVLRKTFLNYKGAQHRFSLKKLRNNISFIDDLAQTPIKFQSLIRSVKQYNPIGNIFVINNTIRFIRIYNEMKQVFNNIDYLLLLNKTDDGLISSFNEDKLNLINSKILNIIEEEDLIKYIKKFVKQNDIIIFNKSILNLKWNKYCLQELPLLINQIHL